jgi:hypothetical protein
MWKPRPGFDYSKYYGRNATVIYNSSGQKNNLAENKVTNGILIGIAENPCDVTVLLTVRSNLNTDYYYDARNAICGEIIQQIKIEDKDIEFAVEYLCKQDLVSDLSDIILNFTDKMIPI